MCASRHTILLSLAVKGCLYLDRITSVREWCQYGVTVYCPMMVAVGQKQPLSLETGLPCPPRQWFHALPISPLQGIAHVH